MVGRTGDLLVRGGALVDGTGTPGAHGRRAGARGVVAEIGADLATRRRGGARRRRRARCAGPGRLPHALRPVAVVGPVCDPMPQHGVTTVVAGNCSLSLAPVRADDRAAASDVFGFIEDIPLAAFLDGIPWNWESYVEWRDALAAHATAVNVAALVGHSNLRVFVMGEAAWERAATDDERGRMCLVLADALAAGALGLSTSFLDTDRHGRPVPSRAADDAELAALVEVLGAAPGTPGVLEFLPYLKELDRQLADIDRVARVCRPHGVPCTWNQLAREQPRSRARRAHRRAGPRPPRRGVPRLRAGVPAPVRPQRQLRRHPCVRGAGGVEPADPGAGGGQAPPPGRRRLARRGACRLGRGRRRVHHLPGEPPRAVRLGNAPAGDEHLAGRTFADLVAARGGHPSDVLADWALALDLAPALKVEAISNNDAGGVAALMADATTVVGASDAGAHLQMMCGAGDATLLLTKHVRDRGDFTVEQGVHELTGRLADAFGLRERGVVAEGNVGDLVVFALDELTYEPEAFVHDVPGGAPRLHAARRRLPRDGRRRGRHPGRWRAHRRAAHRRAHRVTRPATAGEGEPCDHRATR